MTKYVAVHAIQMSAGERQFEGYDETTGRAIYKSPTKMIQPGTLFELEEQAEADRLLAYDAIRLPTEVELIADRRSSDEDLKKVLSADAVKVLSDREIASRKGQGIAGIAGLIG